MLTRIRMFITLLLLLVLMSAAPTARAACNKTAYKEWKTQLYSGQLASNPLFWRYQTQSFFQLKNELALELVVADCTSQFTNLITYLSGRSGPVDAQHAYKAMCSDYCLEADRLSMEALTLTGCSCLDLSTAPSSSFFTKVGDWCDHNTARLLCDILGFCGVWNCRIDDYMCPRYEWDKKIIDLKGPGNCNRNSVGRNHSFSLLIYVGTTLMLSSLLYVGLLI
jgi:hypothetical protein